MVQLRGTCRVVPRSVIEKRAGDRCRLELLAMRAIALACACVCLGGCSRGYLLWLGDRDRDRERADASLCVEPDDGGCDSDAAPRAPTAGCGADRSACGTGCWNDDDCRDEPARICDRALSRCIECRSDADCQESEVGPRCEEYLCKAK